jgi:hypothetical protein
MITGCFPSGRQGRNRPKALIIYSAIQALPSLPCDPTQSQETQEQEDPVSGGSGAPAFHVTPHSQGIVVSWFVLMTSIALHICFRPTSYSG